jgi:mono/diheme cytochrome c family protein
MKFKLIIFLTLVFAWSACGDKKSEGAVSESATEEVIEKAVDADPMSNKGLGPISSVSLGEIDANLAAAGETEFKAKCTACHKISKRHIGPALKGVTERRSPEWIMNMILNPEEMVQKDPIAKQLLIEYNGAPMANQNLTEDEARSILEYFRTKN